MQDRNRPRTRTWRIIEKFNEAAGLPLALLLFLAVPWAVHRWVDDTAAFFSADYLHAPVLAAFLFLCAANAAYLGVRMNWHGLYRETVRHLRDLMDEPVAENLSPPRPDRWRHVLLYVCIYFAYFLIYLAVLAIVLLNVPQVAPAMP